jgi:hypothetical protein
MRPVRPFRLRTLGVALALACAMPVLSGPAFGEAAEVEGFRSAKFEMTEAQLRQAIAADFKTPPAQIVSQLNKIDRTTIISIKQPELLPDSGTAQINYKLGYKNKKLIQIDVIWGLTVDPKVTPASLAAIVVNLRQFLQERGFDKEKTVVNAAMPQPNLVLLFRAQDAKGRVVALLGQFKIDPKAEKGKQILADQPEAVVLSYILDAKSPDVFKIEKGKF